MNVALAVAFGRGCISLMRTHSVDNGQAGKCGIACLVRERTVDQMAMTADPVRHFEYSRIVVVSPLGTLGYLVRDKHSLDLGGGIQGDRYDFGISGDASKAGS